MVEYDFKYTFVPRNPSSYVGRPPTGTISVTARSHSEADQAAYKQFADKYDFETAEAARDAWEISERDVEFADEPWNSLEDLHSRIRSIREVSWARFEPADNKPDIPPHYEVRTQSARHAKITERKLNSYYEGLTINKTGIHLTVIASPRSPPYL